MTTQEAVKKLEALGFVADISALEMRYKHPESKVCFSAEACMDLQALHGIEAADEVYAAVLSAHKRVMAEKGVRILDEDSRTSEQAAADESVRLKHEPTHRAVCRLCDDTGCKCCGIWQGRLPEDTAACNAATMAHYKQEHPGVVLPEVDIELIP